MNLLLYGPPASGKSTAALERFHSVPESYLVTPTATMAEHLRHQLARSGIAVRPSRVTTLARFLDAWSWPIPPQSPPSLLQFLVRDALDTLKPARFAELHQSRELHSAFAGLIDELPDEIPPRAFLPRDLLSVFHHVRTNLAGAGHALRNTRLRIAAAALRDNVSLAAPTHVVFDGFFTFDKDELEFIEALANRSSVTITLPDFAGAKAAQRRLEEAGFCTRRFAEARRREPPQVQFSSATCEREAEEIARRILDHVSQGRRFRDIGIVLRSRDPYALLLETTLARFGIPFRSYFANPLASHPAISYLAGIVNALLGDWDYQDLLPLLRMPVSGLGATPDGDLLDFELREKLPGKGRPDSCPLLLSEVVEGWRTERHSSQAWAERLRSLRKLIPSPKIADFPVDRDQIHVWHSTATAIRAFEEVLQQSATLMGAREETSLAEFWTSIETALAIEPLRVEDRRGDVVHIMDVFEARQWELPIVFLCGLLERAFPQYHREDPLLGDSVRARLGLSTAVQRQHEEIFLFELAKTRASEQLILSYPRFNEKGEEMIPSFFLGDIGRARCDEAVRPVPSRSVAAAPAPAIRDLALTKQLATVHRKLSPSSIETFLQCPFQFFASRTLRLRQRPPAPRDRLNMLEQGNMIHAALAEWTRFPLLGAEVLSRIFEEECSRLRIPRTYRTEAVRLELLRNFEAFRNGPEATLAWHTLVEQPFRFALGKNLTIRGRIDRLETDRDNRALVIDYKYSAGSKIRERVGDSEGGNLVQAGIYMLAAERALGLVPVGMLYCGLKKDVTWGGWHIPLPELDGIGNSCLPDVLQDLMEGAVKSTTEVHEAILSGGIAVSPRDPKKCDWCDYRDACRVETMPAEIGAEAV